MSLHLFLFFHPFIHVFNVMYNPKLFIFVVQVADPNREFFLKSSELFESPVYLEEVADVLCILQAGDCSC